MTLPLPSRMDRRPEWPARWVPALAMLAIAATWLTAPLLNPAPGRPVALVFAPWWPPARALAAAAAVGPVLRVGAWPFIVVVRPDAASRQPGGDARGSAWLALDPIAAGCGDG